MADHNVRVALQKREEVGQADETRLQEVGSDDGEGLQQGLTARERRDARLARTMGVPPPQRLPQATEVRVTAFHGGPPQWREHLQGT